jgi:outer membrane lipoprotein-sorting protein
MIRKANAFFLGLFLASTLFSQTDVKSKSILKKSEEYYKGLSTITADFTLTTSNEGKKPLSNKGLLYIKGTKFRLEYADQIIYCDGKNIWSYNKADAEVTLENYKKKTNDLSPQDMFSLFNRNFKSLVEGSEKVGKENHHIIKLVPKKKKEKFAYVKVLIDDKSYELRKVIQHFKNGSEMTVTVNQMLPNKAINDSFFSWNSSENKEVTLVDLR